MHSECKHEYTRIDKEKGKKLVKHIDDSNIIEKKYKINYINNPKKILNLFIINSSDDFYKHSLL